MCCMVYVLVYVCVCVCVCVLGKLEFRVQDVEIQYPCVHNNYGLLMPLVIIKGRVGVKL